MVTFRERLYFGETIKKKHRKAIYNIRHEKLAPGVYVIAFASNEQNLFDIIPANELLFPFYKKKEIYILGMANGLSEAKIVVKDMVAEVYHKTGGFNVREYFS
ncbi:MAG: hypothetical protein E7256_15890 [Lachnospiraceae bacterium]|nr:hypothetical protein [Lachnospiraceae bacterium]